MHRRNAIMVLGAAAALPLAAQAQQAERPRRIGVLMPFLAGDGEAEARKPAFEQGLRQLGWTVGANLLIEYRLAGGGADAIRRQAAELVALAPDVIVTANIGCQTHLQTGLGAPSTTPSATSVRHWVELLDERLSP